MIGIHLQHPLALRHGLPHGFEHLGHFGIKIVLTGHQADRRVLEATGDAHLGHQILEFFLHQFQQVAKLFFLLFLIGFTEVEIALDGRLERLFLVLAKAGDDDVIEVIGHDQHFDPLLLEHLQVWRGFGADAVAAGDVIDLFLIFAHPLDVFGQGGGFSRLGGG